jgi:putative ABC transport system permease protein
MLMYGYWKSKFGGDPAIVGRMITLSGRTYAVIGVMPREFFFPGRDVQLWLPFAYQPGVFAQARRPHWLGVVARRKPGVSLERAQEEMNAIARRLERQYPDTNTQMGVRLEHLHDSLAYETRPVVLLLAGAVAVLFLLVCVNLANLQLGRGLGRARELAIRGALGADRRRLVRQLLTEALLLSLVGGILGLALAAAGRVALLRFAPSAVPVFADLRLDRSVVIFAIGLTVLAPIVFGIMPALTSARADRLVERADAGTKRISMLRQVLVASEIALSIVLVVGAVLLARSLALLQTVDPGFNPDHVVSFTITLPSARYTDAAARWRAFDDIERGIRQQPGVQAVGATSTLAMRGFTWTGDATVEGRPPTDYERELRHKSVTPGYFAAMGIRLLAGRMLDDRDVRERPPVTIVNDALAKRYFRGADAVGKRITFGRPQDNAPWVTIVGVVADEKQDALNAPVQPEAYTPIAHRMQNPLTFVVRSPLQTDAVVTAARAQVHEVDRDLALTDVATLERVLDESLADTRFRTTLLSAFAGVALLLAALGTYGVLTYFVAQRSRELGIRLALGAKPHALFAMVVGQGMRPIAVGAIAGFASALALTGTIESLLYGVRPLDPATYTLAIGVLIMSGMVACAIPAVRAARVDPLAALREE